jgi:hypothetical protein
MPLRMVLFFAIVAAQVGAQQQQIAPLARLSLSVLGMQLSEDTVSKVNGRVARSLSDAVNDLASSIRRLHWELKNPAPGPSKAKS